MLYYVWSPDADAEYDMSLFVRAGSPEDAAAFWAGYYEETRDGGYDVVIVECPPPAGEGTRNGAISWGDLVQRESKFHVEFNGDGEYDVSPITKQED